MSTLDHLELSRQGFLFDHRRGASYTLNPSGVQLLEWLREGLDREALVERMCHTWDLGAERARRDLDTFLDRLRSQHLLNGELDS